MKMHCLALLVLVLGLAAVQISGIPSRYGPCEGIFSNDPKTIPTGLQDSMLDGCHYFYKLDSLQEQDLSDTLRQCNMVCNENFSDAKENKACSLGCNLMHDHMQGTSDSAMDIPDGVTGKQQGSTNQNVAYGNVTVLTKVDYEKRQFDEEYSRLQNSFIVQMCIFAAVMAAIIFCCVRIIMLICHFRLAEFRFSINNPYNVYHPVVAVQVKGFKRRDPVVVNEETRV